MQNTDLVLSGVTGLTVGTPSPATLSLNAGQSGTVTYPITGTPASCGVLTGVWTKLSLTCTKTTGVSPANFIQPATRISRNTTGNVTAFTANWTSQSGATGYVVEHSTTATGPWNAFPSNPYTGTSASVSGLSGANNYWVSISVQGGTCNGSSAIAFAAASGCLAKDSPTTFKLWLCHDLGADISADPHTAGDAINGASVQ
jgi:hypothetical protein